MRQNDTLKIRFTHDYMTSAWYEMTDTDALAIRYHLMARYNTGRVSVERGLFFRDTFIKFIRGTS